MKDILQWCLKGLAGLTVAMLLVIFGIAAAEQFSQGQIGAGAFLLLLMAGMLALGWYALLATQERDSPEQAVPSGQVARRSQGANDDCPPLSPLPYRRAP